MKYFYIGYLTSMMIFPLYTYYINKKFDNSYLEFVEKLKYRQENQRKWYVLVHFIKLRYI